MLAISFDPKTGLISGLGTPSTLEEALVQITHYKRAIEILCSHHRHCYTVQLDKLESTRGHIDYLSSEMAKNLAALSDLISGTSLSPFLTLIRDESSRLEKQLVSAKMAMKKATTELATQRRSKRSGVLSGSPKSRTR
jgi:hypothetical protein